MRRAEYFITIGLCLFGVFIFLTTNTIPLMVAVEKSSVINSRFFPKLLSILLILLSIIMSAENYFKRSAKDTDDTGSESDTRVENNGWMRVIVLGGLCLLYFFLFEPLGFLVSSALFMFGFSLILKTRKWYVILSLSIVSPLLVYLLFNTLLGAPLPEGIFYF